MSRREGKCYIWTKSDAVSVRRQTQLSCPKDNRLSGQHYTKLSEPGDLQGPEGAAEVGAQMHVILIPIPLSFFHSLHSGGTVLGEADAQSISYVCMVVGCLSVYHKDTLMTWGLPTMYTSLRKQAAPASTGRNSFNQCLWSGLMWENHARNYQRAWLDVKESC